MVDEVHPYTTDDIDSAPDSAPSDESNIDYRELFERQSSRLYELQDEKNDLKTEIHQLKQTISTNKKLNKLIKPYANKSFYFMCAYCSVVGIFVFLHGTKAIKFKLEESVLEYLVGSTAATVLGLVGMVLTGIFVGARK